MSEFLPKQLSQLAEIRMGQSPPSSSYNEEERGIPFLQGCGDFGSKFPNTTVRCTNPTQIAPPGSILISVRAPVGEINLADKEYCIGRGLGCVFSKTHSTGYLYYVLQVKRSELERVSQGSTFTAINSSDLKSLEIDVPHVSVQRKIALILTTIDDQIEKTEALIAKYEAIKQGMMHDLFTRGVDKNGRLRPPQSQAPHLYKQSPLGWIPKEWDVQSLADSQSELIDGDRGENYPSQDEFFEQGHCLFLNTGNVTKNGFRFDNVQFITSSKDSLLGTGKLEGGDIIITTRGTVGNMAYYDASVPFSCMRINSGMLILRNFDSTLANDFLFCSFKHFIFPQESRRVASGSAQPQLPARDLKRFHIVKPPVDEQGTISMRVSNFESKAESETRLLHKLEQIKRGLMQDLLTGKIPVIPDEPDSSEHAEEEVDDQLAASVS